MIFRSGGVLLLILLAVTLGRATAETADASPVVPRISAPSHFLGARDARFRYEGRIDFTDPDAPVVVWEGSRIALDFEGTQLLVRWAGATGQNYFNLQVDDRSEVIGVSPGAGSRTEWPHPLAPGRHRLRLFKRSEATAGQVRFAGVELGAGQQAWSPAAPAYRLRMEFHGDSITAGACDEDGAKDQWDDRRTHNFALSYATLTAAEFHADLRCEAVSGIGIVTGWIDLTAGEMWDKVYPRKDSIRADRMWQPDVLLINLGDNDDDFPRAHHQPFPVTFTTGYVKYVQAIRAANPRAHLVLLTGGMYGGSQSVPLREAWTKAVQQLETADAGISHFVFSHWSSNHPRVADHRALAAELNTWLRQQPFMRPFL